MEEDDGTAGQALQIAGEIAEQIGGGIPVVAVAAQVAQIAGSIWGNNTDDFPGAFSVGLTNNGGSLMTEWNAGDRTEDHGFINNGDTKEFWCVGDNSQYRVYLQAKAR